MARVLLATPAHDWSVTVTYTESLLAAVGQLQGAIELKPAFIGATLVAHARNAFATRVLEDPSFTHLLFIDADMGFSPAAIQRMVAFDREFVGCIAPRRDMDLDRMHRISRQVEDPERAKLVAQDYATTALIPSTVEGKTGFMVEDGFVQAERIGMGLTLIKRSALERLRDAYPDLSAPASGRYKAMGVRETVCQLFESLQGANGLYQSEDFSFCERWRSLGGEIWVCIDELVTHVGRKAFQGRYIERLAFESTQRG